MKIRTSKLDPQCVSVTCNDAELAWIESHLQGQAPAIAPAPAEQPLPLPVPGMGFNENEQEEEEEPTVRCSRPGGLLNNVPVDDGHTLPLPVMNFGRPVKKTRDKNRPVHHAPASPVRNAPMGNTNNGVEPLLLPTMTF
jgi:hypothetical protein